MLALAAISACVGLPAASLANDPYEPNDTLPDAHFLGGPLRPVVDGVQVFTLEDAVLGPIDDKDFFAFTAFANVPIAIRVEPLAAGGDPNDARNLALRLWRRVSAATGEFSLLAQIDFNGAGQGEYHPPIPYTLAGFMVVEIYSNDGLNAAQPYRLRISNAAIDPTPDPDPEMRITNQLDVVSDGDVVDFGAAELGGPSAGVGLVIRNVGAGPLVFTGPPSIQGPAAGDFVLGNLPNEVAPGTFAVFGMSFVPTAVGQRTAVVTLTSNDPVQPNFAFIVTGTGTAAPELQVLIDGVVVADGGNFDFADVDVGSTATVALRIQNTGNAQLDVTSIEFEGADAADFASNVLSASLAPNGAVTGELRFAPPEAGARSATLIVTSNAAPFSIALAGTGVDEGGDDDDGLGDGDDLNNDDDGNDDDDDLGNDDDVNLDDIQDADLDGDNDNLDDNQAQDADDDNLAQDDAEDALDDDDAARQQQEAADNALENLMPPVCGGPICGTGVIGMLPLMLAGLAGVKLRYTRRPTGRRTR